MRWWRIALGSLVALAAAGAAAYAYRRELVLYYVATLAREGRRVAPHREIVFERGPEEPGAPPAGRPPNVVLVLADDLGVNDVSFFGGGVAGGRVPTPSIDAVARAGVAFTRAYAGTAACAPSRAAILTGRYPTRTGFEFTPTPRGMSRILDLFYNDGTRPHPLLMDHAAAARLPPFEDQGLPGSETTFAEVLAPLGYHAVHIGKWHLGSGPRFGPNAQGFHESVMLESGLYLPVDHPDAVNAKLPFDPIDRFLWARMQYATSYNGGQWFEPRGYLTDYYTDLAVAAIEANRHRPFLLYLAHWGVHTPLQASRADYDALSGIEDPRLRVYAAMVRALDRSVGRVVRALEENGLAENTIVIFTSDNGGAGYLGLPEVNAPFRGFKLTFFEGGIRVPLFVRWPARIAAGARSDAPVSHLDLLPTIASAAGAELPSDRPIDGVDLLPPLAGSAPARRALFWRDGHYRAVQADGWKLQVAARPERRWLFDLDHDPTEQVDLSAKRPDKVAELEALLRAHDAGGREPLFPAVGEMPVLIDKTLEEGGTPDDEYVYWPG
jgi:uncharacterized sulfatase